MENFTGGPTNKQTAAEKNVSPNGGNGPNKNNNQTNLGSGNVAGQKLAQRPHGHDAKNPGPGSPNQNKGPGNNQGIARNVPAPTAKKTGDQPAPAQNKPVQLKPDTSPNPAMAKARKKSGNWFAKLSFFIMFVIPTAVIGGYYAYIASDQYRVDSQFSVRGIVQSPFADLGILALPGASSQSGDSYIVTDYIQSSQMIYDMRETMGIDLRSFFSKDTVDVFYRIPPDLPMEEFQKYWAGQINVGFNSTTGNTELQVFAFTADDAKFISEQILLLSEKLVNDLSSKSRAQLIQANQQEVDRTQERLTAVRKKMLDFRDREQAFDPAQVAQVQIGIVTELQGQLTLLQTKKLTIGESIRSDSPAIRVIDNQITALKAQIAEQLAKIGSGKETDPLSIDSAATDDSRSLSQVLDEFSELKLEQEFATTAFTASLAALEQADAQALQQQRYFATYVFPRAPEIALYPNRILNTLIAGFWLFCLWAAFYFIARSVRDHAI